MVYSQPRNIFVKRDVKLTEPPDAEPHVRWCERSAAKAVSYSILVRANYTNLQKGFHETTEYLEVFLRNLLLNEKNELHNRNLHISGLLDEEKVDIGDTKVDIENEKVDIQDKKVDIESVLSEKGSDFPVKTRIHIHRLFEKFGFDEVFGRSAVMELLELKGSGASKLLSNLVKADIIEPVSGHGKGRYKFKK